MTWVLDHLGLIWELTVRHTVLAGIPLILGLLLMYSALDVFVLASHREGFSRASMEAAACGRPMVLTDIRGCREIGQNNESLLLVPPNDARELAQTLSRLIQDAGLRRALSDGAKGQSARFDQRLVAAQSLRAYTASSKASQG